MILLLRLWIFSLISHMLSLQDKMIMTLVFNSLQLLLYLIKSLINLIKTLESCIILRLHLTEFFLNSTIEMIFHVFAHLPEVPLNHFKEFIIE